MPTDKITEQPNGELTLDVTLRLTLNPECIEQWRKDGADEYDIIIGVKSDTLTALKPSRLIRDVEVL